MPIPRALAVALINGTAPAPTPAFSDGGHAGPHIISGCNGPRPRRPPTLPDHEPCVCPDYTSTLHIGDAPCPQRHDLPSAVCGVCAGCKFCRLLDEGALCRRCHRPHQLPNVRTAACP